MNSIATEMTILEKLVDAIRSVIGGADRIALHEPTFGGQEWVYVKECLDTGWVSSAGPFVDRFEKRLCDYTGARHAVAVVNGTAALHMALLDARVQPGDEVLVPSLTFAATANAVVHACAVPHFVDSTWQTLGIDPGRLARYLASIVRMQAGVAVNRTTGRPIRALVPVHIFGHCGNMDALTAVAHDYRLEVIEDCTEALGTRVQERVVGANSRYAVLSFNGNKIVTTGGGGAILTNDADVASRIRHMTTTAKAPHRWAFEHDAAGYNYRLPNLNAALGCAQLEQLEYFVQKKRRLAERYFDAFETFDGVKMFREPPLCSSNYWLNSLVIEPSVGVARDEILEACHAAGILARPVWRLLHELRHFASSPRMPAPVAEDIQKRVVNLPSSAHLIA